jgi:hypothetical protein
LFSPSRRLSVAPPWLKVSSHPNSESGGIRPHSVDIGLSMPVSSAAFSTAVSAFLLQPSIAVAINAKLRVHPIDFVRLGHLKATLFPNASQGTSLEVFV